VKGNSEPNTPQGESKYLDAVREFADNVLKYGRDNYGTKHTPLFVDGLNIHTHEPVKWISPKEEFLREWQVKRTGGLGTEEWILSDFASQQILLRTLDGLSTLSGDPTYREAAMQAIKYTFENLRSPNGILYWGGTTAYDALGDTVCGDKEGEVLKLDYPHYELMWKVDPEATEQLIRVIWSGHVVDWSNLEIDRFGLRSEDIEEPWNHEYERESTFFEGKRSWGSSNILTASSLIQAGAILNRLANQQQPLIWSKRLAKRFVDTRQPRTGISSITYNLPHWKHELIEKVQGDANNPNTAVFPWDLFQAPPRSHYYPENAHAHPWIAFLLVGKLLGEEGGEFTQWALEELTAWGKSSYRKEDNCFVPMLTDGTSLEGYIWKDGPGQSTGYNRVRLYPADLSFFWAYCIAYSRTGDDFMWEMARSIALGNGLGDIGQAPMSGPALQTTTICSHPYGVFGLLELYRRTNQRGHLEVARRIADNIVATHFHKGFFIPSKKHFYARFDCFEPLALLRLEAVMTSEGEAVPQPWPALPLFIHGYRYKLQGIDRHLIYGYTESSQPPLSIEEAAAVGDVDLIRRLIEKGVKVEAFDSLSYMTPLHRAAMEGQTLTVKYLLAAGAPIDERDMNLYTPLHYAVDRNHKETSELLIAHGADIHAELGSGDTPLHTAARAGYTDIVDLLIDKGANVTAKNAKGQTPLDIALRQNQKDITAMITAQGAEVSSIHMAAKLGDQAKVKAFLDQGVDINAKDDNEYTPLFHAIREEHESLISFLISRNADINAKDKWGYTPLYYAIWNEDANMVRLLVDKGADVNVRPDGDGTPLIYAVWNEDLEMAKLFVSKGAKINAKDDESMTAFRSAVLQANREFVEFFVDQGVDVSGIHGAACMGDLVRIKSHLEQGTEVDAKDELGWTPLFWAASMGQSEVGLFLLSKGAKANTKIQNEHTPLHQAAKSGAFQLVEALISKGADVNAKGKQGNTPLHNAAVGGHRQVAELLIANGAEVNAKAKNNWTPLHRAILAGQKDVAETMIRHGADMAVKDSRGRIALDLAKQCGHKEIAQRLLDEMTNIDARDEEGRTILHRAASEGWTEELQRILQSKPDLNAKDNAGRTPLHYAVGGNTGTIQTFSWRPAENNLRVDVGRLLIERGADVNIQDKYGLSPLAYAVVNMNKDFVLLLLNNGAYIDTRDNGGREPMHYAFGAGPGGFLPQGWSVDIGQLLLEHGANINARDNIGWIPLHYATIMTEESAVNFLIEKNANFDRADNRGCTPYSLACAMAENVSSGMTKYHHPWIELAPKVRELLRKAYDDSAIEPNIQTIGKESTQAALGAIHEGHCFVATNGNDANPGTLESPLKTLAAAVRFAEPNDVIVVRGGLYHCSQTIHLNRSGEPGKLIVIKAYPNEVPVFDCSGLGFNSSYSCLYITGAYWHLRGLVFTKGPGYGISMRGNGAHHNILEEIVFYDHRFQGITLERGPAYNVILNCDAHNNFDRHWNGEDGEGFGFFWGVGQGNVFIGSRAWDNADDGVDLMGAEEAVRVENCYSWKSGENIWDWPFFVGNGIGFKLGGHEGRHILINCLSWGNTNYGFSLNGNTSGVILRNCTAWDNGINYSFHYESWPEQGRKNCVFVNNISINGRHEDRIHGEAKSQNNTWDPALGITLTDADLLSFDDSKMSAPRNPDGNIPYNNFLRLAQGSAAIDAGTDINMPYVGKAPDLGAFEYDPNENTENYVKMLHQYVRDHDVDKIDEMLTVGADIIEKDWLGYTPLHWACYFGYTDLVELLLSKGADPNLISDTGRTCLEIATEMNYDSISELLRKHGAIK